MNKNCVLIKSHKFGTEETDLYSALAPLTSQGYEVIFLLDGDHVTLPDRFPAFAFTAADVYSRRWPVNLINPYNAEDAARPLHNWFGHYAPILFHEKNPQYQFYWMIEYDLKLYGGSNFIRAFENRPGDFLSTRLISEFKHEKYASYTWERWRQHNLPVATSMGCFFPMNRFSVKAMQSLRHAAYSGQHGYCEVFVPTLFAMHGLAMEDLAEIDRTLVRNTLHKNYHDFRYETKNFSWWRNKIRRIRYADRDEPAFNQ